MKLNLVRDRKSQGALEAELLAWEAEGKGRMIRMNWVYEE